MEPATNRAWTCPLDECPSRRTTLYARRQDRSYRSARRFGCRFFLRSSNAASARIDAWSISDMCIRMYRFLARTTIAATCCLFAHCAPLAAAWENQVAAYIREDNRYIYAGNDRVELTFQKTDGRLYSLADKTSLLDFLARKDAFWGPFNFQITVSGQDEYINGSQSQPLHLRSLQRRGRARAFPELGQFRGSRPCPPVSGRRPTAMWGTCSRISATIRSSSACSSTPRRHCCRRKANTKSL